MNKGFIFAQLSAFIASNIYVENKIVGPKNQYKLLLADASFYIAAAIYVLLAYKKKLMKYVFHCLPLNNLLVIAVRS